MNENEKKVVIGESGIYDAKKLGIPKMVILGLQHTFAMFGATVLVPLITGLDVSTALLMAGLGTLLFHFLTKGKVPAFLGSSFAFLGGFAIVAPMLKDEAGNTVANLDVYKRQALRQDRHHPAGQTDRLRPHGGRPRQRIAGGCVPGTGGRP